MKRLFSAFAVGVALLLPAQWAVAAPSPPPVEVYGDLPTVREMSLSPDGTHVAFLKREKGRDFFSIAKVTGGIAQAVEVEGFEARFVRWAGDSHAILVGTKMTYEVGIGDYRYGAAISLNRENGKTAQLLSQGRDLAPFRTGSSTDIEYVSGDGRNVYMRGAQTSGSPAMFEVDLDTGRGKKKYNLSGRNVFLDEKGEIAFEVDYNRGARRYEIIRRVGGDRRRIWIEENIKTDASGLLFPKVRLAGWNHDRTALVIRYDEEQSPDSFAKIKEMSFDGEILPSSIPDVPGMDQLGGLIRADDGSIIGKSYAGLTPVYSFADPDFDQLVLSAQATFPENAVRLVDFSADMSRVLLQVSGGTAANDYYLLDRTKGGIVPLGAGYPEVQKEQIGFVDIIEYKARDGMIIPALVTWPAGVEPGQGRNLPMVVIPHGGPEAHDVLSFDWFAQLPASRGILVIQPQFRGSDGFGRAFRDAGRGKWGKEMQDDVTDAVLFAIKQGWADPERVCIFGWSYGGYSTMAGATFSSPELYRCAIAGAGVSDLPRILYTESRDNGSDSPVVAYWNRVIGDRREDRDRLKDVSPVNFVDRVQAPMLVIHGEDDDVVLIEQSERFVKALQDAGKSVEFLRIKDEDHWLSKPEGRIATARAVASFLDEHLKN